MANTEQRDLSDLFLKFKIKETYLSSEPYGSGHINDTYLVKTKESLDSQNSQNSQNNFNKNIKYFDYIFQRINHKIFKNVPELMSNIARVTSHLRAKLLNIPGANPDRETLTVINTHDDQPFYQDELGNYWRVYIFLDHTHSYDQVTDPKIAYEGGLAFGKFQKLLADIPAPKLFETIKNFHDIDSRFNLFTQALNKDIKNRAKDLEPEINYVKSRYETMRTILKLGAEGKIPLRVTHNDTKFNNVLLDSQDKGLCVIDLDTVMPGYIHYDFGDSLRTAANTAPEDEVDLTKVSMNIQLFEGFAKGFLSQVGKALTPTEIEYLPLATALLPYTIGLRFLTDYLDGDQYFKIHRPSHNLDRARCQFQLSRSAESQKDRMAEIIREALQ